LQPHRLRTFKGSRDPGFAGKLTDIVGLYVGLSAGTWRSHAAADHRAVEHAKRGEQGGGAVPLVSWSGSAPV
jgi:hypothetical protein